MENASHGCTKDFRRKNVRTIPAQENSVKPCGIRCPDYSSDISGILKSVQSNQTPSYGLLCICPDDGSDPLRGFGGTDRLKNMICKTAAGNVSGYRESRIIILPEDNHINGKIGIQRFRYHLGTFYKKRPGGISAFFFAQRTQEGDFPVVQGCNCFRHISS